LDQFDVLDSALRSRYLELDALPAAPVWGHLPGELRAALADALAAGEQLGAALRLVWQIRAQLLGKPDSSDTRTQETAALLLGLLYLRHRERRLEAGELLTRAFHVADSFVCGVDPRPFLRLRRELEAGVPDGGRVAALFAPYTAPAEQCAQQWGLCPGAVTGEQRQAEPVAEPDPATKFVSRFWPACGCRDWCRGRAGERGCSAA
jgi:hypothetical protein